MKEVITSILTDASARAASSVEAAFISQAVASPWQNEG